MCGSKGIKTVVLTAAIILSFFIFNQTNTSIPLTAEEDDKALRVKDTFDWEHLKKLNKDIRSHPAMPSGEFRKVFQPDGTPFKARRMGMESYNWVETRSGHIIKENVETGYYEYLTLGKDKKYKFSGVRVGIDSPKDFGIKRYVREPKEVITAKVNRFNSLTEQPRKRITKEGKEIDVPPDTPASGRVKQLIVLVNFGSSENTYTQEEWQEYFTGDDYDFQGAHGSFRDYYLEVSHGALDLDTYVTDWYSLPHGSRYYKAGEDNPNAYDDLCNDTIDALEAAGFDFSPYDGNGDGYVDSFGIIHWGEGGENSSSSSSIYIWSKMDELATPRVVDGVRIGQFFTAPEMKQMEFALGGTPALRAGIGVSVHEFGHALGLEDVYGKGPGAGEGAGRWCLMGNGCYLDDSKRPSHPLMYHKIKLGWVTPTVLRSSASRLELRRVDRYPEVYQVSRNMRSDEYLLLENRQLSGFDSALPGHGLIVTHVDDRIEQNTDPDRYKVAIIQADGDRDLEEDRNRGDSGDPYPGSSENFNLTPLTNPSTDANSGRSSGIYISNIGEASRKIVFDLGLFSAPDNPYWPGPDSFGYYGSKTSGGFEDISSTGTAVSFTNRKDGTATISFPNKFKFYFYRTKSSRPGMELIGSRSCKVSTNGWLAFTGGGLVTSTSSHPTNKVIPNSLAPSYLMAPLWDNFRVDKPGTYVKYKLVGAKRNRTLIIQWSVRKQTTLFGSRRDIAPAKKPDAIFQVKLHESGIIEFCYNKVGRSDNKATIGIQKDGATGLRYSTDGERDLAAGDRLLIVRNNLPPMGTLVTPGGASGRGTTFSSTFMDPDGALDLKECYFLVSSTANPANGVYAIYNNINGNIGLRNNANSAWQYGRAGSATVLTNNRAELDLSGASVSKSGNMLTLNLPIVFKGSFNGLKNIYLKTLDKVGHESEWGSIWTYRIRTNTIPQVTGIRTNIGKGNHDTFTCEFRDMDGSSDVKALYFLMHDGFATSGGIYLKYTLADNIVWLRNVSDTAWIKGTAGSGTVLSNNNVEIGLSGAGVVMAGVNLELVFPAVFKPAFSGAKNIFLKVEDYSETTSDWRPVGIYPVVH